jgi:hypothetical protein
MSRQVQLGAAHLRGVGVDPGASESELGSPFMVVEIPGKINAVLAGFMG